MGISRQERGPHIEEMREFLRDKLTHSPSAVDHNFDITEIAEEGATPDALFLTLSDGRMVEVSFEIVEAD